VVQHHISVGHEPPRPGSAPPPRGKSSGPRSARAAAWRTHAGPPDHDPTTSVRREPPDAPEWVRPDAGQPSLLPVPAGWTGLASRKHRLGWHGPGKQSRQIDVRIGSRLAPGLRAEQPQRRKGKSTLQQRSRSSESFGSDHSGNGLAQLSCNDSRRVAQLQPDVSDQLRADCLSSTAPSLGPGKLRFATQKPPQSAGSRRVKSNRAAPPPLPYPPCTVSTSCIFAIS